MIACYPSQYLNSRLNIIAILATTLLAAPLFVTAQSTQSCVALTRNLSFGSRGPDVVRLQQFFNYEYFSFYSSYATGYFGSITQAAVKQWQAGQGIVSSGTPATTGFGAVGPKTRAAMNSCTSTSKSSATTPSSAPPLSGGSGVSNTISISRGSGSSSNPPAFVSSSVPSLPSAPPILSPVTAPVVAASSTTTATINICSGLTNLSGSASDASLVLQNCLDTAATGTVVALPAGTYDIAHQIHILKPLTLTTQGKTQSMAPCTLNDATCAQLVADPNFSQQWGVMTVGDNPPPSGGSLTNVTLDHIIINGNNKARWSGPAGVQLAPPIENTGIGHNLMVFDCSDCTFTNNVLKNGLSATAFGYGYVYPAQGYPAVHNHDTLISNNLIAYNGVHNRSLSWSDGFTFNDGDHFTITYNTFIDNTDGQFIMGGCTNCIIQHNSLTNTGSVEGGSYVALNLQTWVYPLTNGTQVSSGDYTGTDISYNAIDCSSNQRCGFGIYLGDKAWGFQPSGAIKGGYIHDNTITNAQQGINVDTITGTIFENNTITNSGGTFPTNRGSRTMNLCNIAPDAQITFSNNNILVSQCTSDDSWYNPQYVIPNWWVSTSTAPANFTWYSIGTSSTTYSVVGIGDFNHSGGSELMFRNNTTGDMGYYQIVNNSTIWHHIGGSSPNYSVVGIGDFNKSGTSEVMFRDATGDMGYYQIGNNDTFTWHVLGGISTSTYSVVDIGDFNDSGTSEIMFRNASGDMGYDVVNADGTVPTWHHIGSSTPSYAVVGIGDFNNSGTAEVLFSNPTTGDAGYYQINSNDTFTWHHLGVLAAGYSVVGVGNFDNAGGSEIMMRDLTGDMGYYSISSDVPIWHPVGASTATYSTVGIGDFNNSGTSEVMFRGPSGDLGYYKIGN